MWKCQKSFKIYGMFNLPQYTCYISQDKSLMFNNLHIVMVSYIQMQKMRKIWDSVIMKMETFKADFRSVINTK